jgi:MFS family permease
MVNQSAGPQHPLAKLAVLMSGNVLMTFMISAVMPASSAIARNFSALGQVDLHAQILLLAPYIALIFVAPLSGVLIKNYGRRVPLLMAIGVYACAGGAELFTNAFWPLVGERVLLGAGGGAITTICMTLAGDYFAGAKRTWAVALVGMATAPGSVLVLLVSGVLVDWGGWHLAFAPYLLAIPVFFAALFIIEEPATPAEDMMSGGALPRFFWLLCLVTMFEACTAILPAVQLPFLLSAIGITHATTASVLIALSACVAVAAGSFYPIMRRYLSVNTVLVLIFSTAAVSYFAFFIANDFYSIGLALLIIGLPTGLMIPHFSAVAIERATAEARGRAVGLITSSICIGQVSIPMVVAPLRAALGMKNMFVVLALVLAAASLFAAFIPRLRKVQHVPGYVERY